MAENTTVGPTFPKAAFIDVEAGVRYWEDATVNGAPEDDDAPTIFGSAKDVWSVRINLATGQIVGWPEGMTADVHYKVCDAGLYWLADTDGQRIAKWSGHYVPNAFLCPDSEGYGDYIIMQVGSNGVIANWVTPEIEAGEWRCLKASPRAGEG